MGVSKHNEGDAVILCGDSVRFVDGTTVRGFNICNGSVAARAQGRNVNGEHRACILLFVTGGDTGGRLIGTCPDLSRYVLGIGNSGYREMLFSDTMVCAILFRMSLGRLERMLQVKRHISA